MTSGRVPMMQAHNRRLDSEIFEGNSWRGINIYFVDALPARETRGGKERQPQSTTNAKERADMASRPGAKKAE
jgi:hypothetical protein